MMIHSLVAAILVMMLAASAACRAADIELIGQPCRSFNVLAGRVIAGAEGAAGAERLVLTNMNETSGCELIFIDLKTGKGKTCRAPAGAGAWALNVVPGNRMIVGTFFDGMFMTFDLGAMAFTKTAKFPGEQYIWNLAAGNDGRIYGGTYPGGRLGALDLDSNAVESFDNPAKPNLYLRNVSATPDGRILCQWGMDKITTMLFDPKTKKFAPVPAQLKGIQIGVTWNGYFLSGNTWDGKPGSSLVFKGPDFQAVSPAPFPTPPGKWRIDTYATTAKMLFLRDEKNEVYRFEAGGKTLQRITDFDIRGQLLAGTANGGIAGVRGQDYFVLGPGSTEQHLRPIPVESGPRPSHFLRMDDRNRLWGGPTFGQTLFYMDVNSKKVVNTSQVCDSGGEVYDVCFLNGKTYAAAYSGGDIIEYDPDQPWDQWNNKNPRTLEHLGSKGYIRPVAGIVVGPDHKLYAGWMAHYGTYGGAISITDPADGKTQLIENPLGEQAIAGVASDGRFLYAGTSLSANGLPNKKDESPKFGMIDQATRKVVFSKTFEKAGGVDRLLREPRSGMIAFCVDGKISIFDPSRRAITPTGADVPTATGPRMAWAGEAQLCYAHEKSIVFLDLKTLKAATVAEAPVHIQALTATLDGTVYVACATKVYRVIP
jgi:hypothetical protein